MAWFRKYFGWVFPALGWVLTGISAAFNWIGRSTVSDDAKYAAGVMEKAADWFFSLPTWGVALFAVALTAIYWFWMFSAQSAPSPIESTAGKSIDPLSERRAALISDCRVIATRYTKSPLHNTPDFAEYLGRQPEYAEIQGHLSMDFKRVLSGSIIVVPPSGPKPYDMKVLKFLEELDRLEAEWKV